MDDSPNPQSAERSQRLLRTLRAVEETWGRGLGDLLKSLFASTDADVREARAQILKGGSLAETLIPQWVRCSPAGARPAVGKALVSAATAVMQEELYARGRKGHLKLSAERITHDAIVQRVATRTSKQKGADGRDEEVHEALGGLLSNYKATLPLLTSVVLSLARTTNESERAKKNGGKLGAEKKERVEPTITAVISMLLYLHNRSCNAYPLLLGLFLSSYRVSRVVTETFHRLSISVAYQTTQVAYSALLRDKESRVQLRFAPPPLGQGEPHHYCFDNLDLLLRVTNERGGHTREMLHVAIGAVVAFSKDDVPPEAHSPATQAAAEAARGRGNERFKLSELYGGADQQQHRREARLHQIVLLLIEYFPLTSPGQPPKTAGEEEHRVAKMRKEMRVAKVDKVNFRCSRTKKDPSAKTERYGLPLVDENVGTLDGVLRYMKKTRDSVEGEHPMRSKCAKAFVGDLGVVKNVHGVQRLTEIEYRREDRHTEVYSEPLPFHISLAFEGLLCKAYGAEGPATDNPGAIHHVSIFSRGASLPPDNSHHYDVISVLTTVVAGGVLAAAAHVRKRSSLTGLAAERISTLSQLEELAAEIDIELKGFRGAARQALEGEIVDEVNGNWLLGMHDVLLLLEYERAVKAADYGAMWEVYDQLVFLFKAQGNWKYANALLEMAIRHRHEYPEAICRLMEATWLTNVTGKPDGNEGSDLTTEHAVFWTKDGAEASHGNTTFSLLRTTSATADTREFLKTSFPRSAGLKVYSRPHHSLPRTQDVVNTFIHLVENGVAVRNFEGKKREVEGGVVDLFGKGVHDWAGGVGSDFKHYMSERVNRQGVKTHAEGGMADVGPGRDAEEDAAEDAQHSPSFRISFEPLIDDE